MSLTKKIDLEIKVPQNWSAVTLRQYLALIKDMEVYKDTPEAVDAALFHHLCGVEPKYLSKLDISIYMDIREQLYKLINIGDSPLKRIVKIGDVNYGFEPNLSEMEYGAYLDLQKFGEVRIDENWSKIMNILYRPVKGNVGALYEIETYSAKDNSEKFLDITMDVHFGAMFFFLHTLMDLLNATQNSLKKELAKRVDKLDITSIKSGEVTQQSINWLKGISLNTMKF
jgi:hypothetical protein